MEAFPGTTPCIQAVQTFVNEWNAVVESNGFKTVYYESTCGSYPNNMADIAWWPRELWGARHDGNPHTSEMSCVDPGNWWNQERHKQYAGTHPEQWSWLVISIDNDCANSWLAPSDRWNPFNADCV
jgi:hypothetical protein